MNRVALAAEKAGHHPDWSKLVEQGGDRLMSHDARGITERDNNRPRRSTRCCHDRAASERTTVANAARDLDLAIEIRRFPDGTKTAADAAARDRRRCRTDRQSLVFAVDGEVVMALVSGSNPLDEGKLAAVAGGAMCARVDADIVREATGFPIGACRRLVTRPRAGLRRSRSVHLAEVWAPPAPGTTSSVSIRKGSSKHGGTVVDLKR